jgi:hypothetical protein
MQFFDLGSREYLEMDDSTVHKVVHLKAKKNGQGDRVTRMFKTVNPANGRPMVRFAKEAEFDAFPGEVITERAEPKPVPQPALADE